VQEADLFRFSALPQHYDTSLYTAPVWSVPFGLHKVSLLDLM
jgi:hypothetical protein